MTDIMISIHLHSAAFFESDYTRAALAVVFVLTAYFVANIDRGQNV